MQRRALFFSSLLGLGVIGIASVAVPAHAATLTASVTVNATIRDHEPRDDVADWANEENLAPEVKTEGNVFNRRPTIVGNRGTIGLAKIRTG